MSVRAKFQVQEVTTYNYGGKKIVLRPQYDTTIPEDQRFCKATPTGEFSMTVDNPVAADQLIPGKFFYIDLTEVPESTAGQSPA